MYCLVLLSSNFGPRGTLGLQLSGIVWFFCLAISGLEGHWGSSCRVHIAWSFCLATSVPKENWGSSCRLCSVLFSLCREAQRDPERPREAQRGPERPREAQRGPERPREAQRASEKHRDAQRGPERLRKTHRDAQKSSTEQKTESPQAVPREMM